MDASRDRRGRHNAAVKSVRRPEDRSYRFFFFVLGLAAGFVACFFAGFADFASCLPGSGFEEWVTGFDFSAALGEALTAIDLAAAFNSGFPAVAGGGATGTGAAAAALPFFPFGPGFAG